MKVLTTIVLLGVSFALLWTAYRVVTTPMVLLEPQANAEPAPMQPTAQTTATVNTTPQVVIAVMATREPTPRRDPTPDMTCKASDPTGTVCKKSWVQETPDQEVAITATPYPPCSQPGVLIDDWCVKGEPSMAEKDQ